MKNIMDSKKFMKAKKNLAMKTATDKVEAKRNSGSQAHVGKVVDPRLFALGELVKKQQAA